MQTKEEQTAESQHVRWMSMALRLAEENVVRGGGPFGAVVVRNGKVLGTGVNRVTQNHDATAHAEVMALRNAGDMEGTHHLEGAVLYASCAPCPMCLAACYWAGIEHVYYAGTTAQAAEAGFDDAFIYNELQLDVGERRLPLTPLLSEEGWRPFAAWARYDNKELY